MIRYGFNIRTRMGQRVENIMIMAGTQNDAERRLRQMYHDLLRAPQCQVIRRHWNQQQVSGEDGVERQDIEQRTTVDHDGLWRCGG